MRVAIGLLTLFVSLSCCGIETAKAVDASFPNSGDPLADVAALRAKGPSGLDKLFIANALVIADHQKRVASGVMRDQDPQWLAFCTAADAVARQKDAAYAHLYWFTDLEAAKAAARASGKPILSLRLLGSLDTELSCANSRFFRTALYANATVSAYLREHFILHWQSVRPVPVISIDFGDGRVVKRTIAGNSIHWILDPQGRPIDALPGLYGPAAFLRGLKAAEAIAREQMMPGSSSEQTYQSELAAFHRHAIADIDQQRTFDSAAIGATTPKAIPTAATSAPPTIVAASRMTFSKTIAQQPAIRLVASDSVRSEADTNTGETAIAALHADDAKLDPSSIALIAEKRPDRGALPQLVESFGRSMAIDTIRDEYDLHRTIHQWLANATGASVDSLNDRVYSELFLTPASDPWMGMGTADAYTAIADDGTTGR